MNLWIKSVIIIYILICGIAALAVGLKRKKGNTRDNRPDKKSFSHKSMEEQQKRRRELYSREQEIVQEMILLIGGKTGMIMLREMYNDTKGTPESRFYRDSFLRKQRILKEKYEEYLSVHKMLGEYPQDPVNPLTDLKDEELYKELIRVKLQDS